jgi:DNA invertase Pin-like site-specific DNA recombinase
MKKTVPAAENKRQAIGYARFSSDGQADGNSIERQTASINDYCKKNNLHLVETLIDDGFSASKGHHISKGALGQFLTEADAGKYRGFALVIEEKTRLSRLGISETSDLVKRILRAGVMIHLSGSGRVISDLNDLATYIMEGVSDYAAAEFSKQLKTKVTSAWRTNKANAANRVVTSNVPAWLRVEGEIGKDAKIVELPDMVETVREVFRLASLGLGCRKIKAALNGKSEGISEVWILNTLRNEAVLGTYQPHMDDGTGNRVHDGAPHHGYYPRIISETEWATARHAVDSRNRQGKDGQKRCAMGRTSGQTENLFPGLLFDTTISTTPIALWFQKKSDTEKFLVTNCAKTAELGIKGHRMAYAKFEKAFRLFIRDLDWQAVIAQGTPEELTDAQDKLSKKTDELANAQRQAKKYDALMDAEEELAMRRVFARKVTEFEGQVSYLETEVQKLSDTFSEIKARLALMESPEVLFKLLDSGDADTRLRLKSEIAKRVSRIEIRFPTFPTDDMTEDQRDVCYPTTQITISYVNGVRHFCELLTDGRMQVRRDTGRTLDGIKATIKAMVSRKQKEAHK